MMIFVIIFWAWLLSWITSLQLDPIFCLWVALILFYCIEFLEPLETMHYSVDTIHFYPTIARLVSAADIDNDNAQDGVQNDHKKILVPIHGSIFDCSPYGIRKMGLALLSRTLRLDPKDEDAMKYFLARASTFLADNKRGKRVTITFDMDPDNEEPATQELQTLTGPNGHFTEEVSLNYDDFARPFSDRPRRQDRGKYYPDGCPKWIRFQSVPTGLQRNRFIGCAMVLKPEGVSVISDIDDTVKQSYVCDKRELMRNSFLRRYSAVPGMVSLYKKWEQQVDARFHFVSGSPWQLSQPLLQFFEEEGFPRATLHLRNFRWKDSSFFDMLSSPIHGKRRLITPIFKNFPGRKFICVGDTGEHDPEVYAEIALQFPGQVRAIFLRRAPHKSPVAKIAARVAETIGEGVDILEGSHGHGGKSAGEKKALEEDIRADNERYMQKQERRGRKRADKVEVGFNVNAESLHSSTKEGVHAQHVEDSDEADTTESEVSSSSDEADMTPTKEKDDKEEGEKEQEETKDEEKAPKKDDEAPKKDEDGKKDDEEAPKKDQEAPKEDEQAISKKDEDATPKKEGEPAAALSAADKKKAEAEEKARKLKEEQEAKEKKRLEEEEKKEKELEIKRKEDEKARWATVFGPFEGKLLWKVFDDPAELADIDIAALCAD